MDWTKGTKIKAIIFLILAFLLYSYKLSYTPVHLNQDELEFSLNAYSLVTTGKSQTGMPFPIYFPHLELFWSTPVAVYLTSFLLLFLPFGESTIRLSSVIMAILSMFLAYKLGEVLFKNRKSTLLISFLMLTSPTLFINSRLLLDNIYTIPFVLSWLLFLKIYLENKKVKYLCFSALSLGIGIHSYHAAKIIMPLYAFLTAIFLALSLKKQRIKNIIIFLVIFVLPFVIFIPWFLKYPDSLLHQVKYLSNFDSSINASKGLLGVFNLQRLLPILGRFASYFSPGIIFFYGDRSLIHSTGQIGVFSYFVIPFFILGTISILVQKKNNFAKFLLLIFLTFPIASAIVNDPQRISRSLVVIPLLSIIAAYGYDYLIESREKVNKIFAQILIILICVHFALFLKDYFGDYRIRSQAWFNYNIPSAMQTLINLDKNNSYNTIYLDEMTGFVDRYYKFYAIKNSYFNKSPQLYKFANPPVFPPNSLVLVRFDHLGKLLQLSPDLKIKSQIYEPSGMVSFYILTK